MTSEMLINVAAAVTCWLVVVAAGLSLLGRRPAGVRRAACRLGLLGVPVVLVGAALVHGWRPSRGLFVRRGRTASAAVVPSPDGKRLRPRPTPAAARKAPAEMQAAKAARAERERPQRARSTPRPAASAEAAKTAPPALPVAKVPAQPPPSVLEPVSTPTRRRAPVRWAPTAAVCAAAVGVLYLLVLAARLVRLASWRRRWRPAPPAWTSLTRRLARRIGLTRPFGVFVARGVSQPAAAGLIRAAIVLPDQPPTTRRAAVRGALAHELGHLAGRDPLWNVLARAVLALAWWCPLVWWLERRARIEAELAADDHALGGGVQPIDLARTLASFARRVRQPTPAGVSGMACHLRRRIEMIMNAEQPHDAKVSGRSRWLLGLAAGAIVAWIVGTPLVGVARADEERGEEGGRVRRREGGEREGKARDREGDREREGRRRAREEGDRRVREEGDEGRRRDGDREGRERDRGERRDLEREGDRPRRGDERRREGRFVSSARVVCRVRVVDGWVVAEARARRGERKMLWTVRLVHFTKEAKMTVRYDGPFVVVTYGAKRFVIDGETGQLRPTKVLAGEGRRVARREGDRGVEERPRRDGDRADREGVEGRRRRDRDRDAGEGEEGGRRRDRDRDGEEGAAKRPRRDRDAEVGEEGERRRDRDRGDQEGEEARWRRDRDRVGDKGGEEGRRDRDREREGEGRWRGREREGVRAEAALREGTKATNVVELKRYIERLRRQLAEAERLLVRLEKQKATETAPRDRSIRSVQEGERRREGEKEGERD